MAEGLPSPSPNLRESYMEYVMKLLLYVKNNIDNLIEHVQYGDYYSARFIAQTMMRNLAEVAKFCNMMIERGEGRIVR